MSRYVQHIQLTLSVIRWKAGLAVKLFSSHLSSYKQFILSKPACHSSTFNCNRLAHFPFTLGSFSSLTCRKVWLLNGTGVARAGREENYKIGSKKKKTCISCPFQKVFMKGVKKAENNQKQNF